MGKFIWGVVAGINTGNARWQYVFRKMPFTALKYNLNVYIKHCST